MSSTSFGGSFHLVSSNDEKLKNIFLDYLKRLSVESQFPLAKYFPLTDVQGPMYQMIDDIIEKRQAEKGEPKKDLVQIFIDTNKADPVNFSNLHLREEMILFM